MIAQCMSFTDVTIAAGGSGFVASVLARFFIHVRFGRWDR